VLAFGIRYLNGFVAARTAPDDVGHERADGHLLGMGIALPNGNRARKEQKKAEASRPVIARTPIKTIGIYDALEEQQARERAAKVKSEKPEGAQ
jgi:hypothetical protein